MNRAISLRSALAGYGFAIWIIVAAVATLATGGSR